MFFWSDTLLALRDKRMGLRVLAKWSRRLLGIWELEQDQEGEEEEVVVEEEERGWRQGRRGAVPVETSSSSEAEEEEAEEEEAEEEEAEEAERVPVAYS